MPTSQMINLQNQVDKYKEVLQNAQKYRKLWDEGLKETLINEFKRLVEETGLKATVDTHEKVSNLEAIEVSLGNIKTDLLRKVSEEIERPLIKYNGSLIYQQLFNGKVIVMIHYPYIEGYGQPRKPKTLSIYRPEEIETEFCARHLEEFLKDVTNWEDYDDDEPQQKIGFELNFDNSGGGGSNM